MESVFAGLGVGDFAVSALVLACGAVAEEKRGNGLEEVTVTAQKREASIQDVPVFLPASPAAELGADHVQVIA